MLNKGRKFFTLVSQSNMNFSSSDLKKPSKDQSHIKFLKEFLKEKKTDFF